MNFNLAGFIHTLIVILLASLTAGLIAGFLASVSVVAVLILACWCYRTLAISRPSQRVQTIKFGTAYYRVEVA